MYTFRKIPTLLFVLSFSACKGSAEITVELPVTPGPLQWVADAYAKGNPSAMNNQYGYSVAIDGDTAVVGARDEGTPASGAAYVLRRVNGTWVQEAYLKPPALTSETGDNFGASVAVSGDTIVVGATGEDSNQTTITNGTTSSSNNSAGQSGAAFVFRRSGSTWTQEAYVKAPNLDSSDFFGYSVAISGDTIAVGAPGEQSSLTTIFNTLPITLNNSASSAGAVYVFRRSGVNWAFESYIKAPNAPPNSTPADEFGRAVAIDGDTIVAGAYHEDGLLGLIINGGPVTDNDGATDSGAAYVFRRTGSAWAFESYLKASNAGPGDEFGTSVAISGDTIAVGAPGEDNGQFTITNGGAIFETITASNSGAAYIFKRTGVNWSEEAYLKPSNCGPGIRFGNSISLSGDAAITGTDSESSHLTGITQGTISLYSISATNSGAAYALRRSGTAWAQEAYFKAANAEANDRFGGMVAISGENFITGARQEAYSGIGVFSGGGLGFGNGASNSGAAYLFNRRSAP